MLTEPLTYEARHACLIGHLSASGQEGMGHYDRLADQLVQQVIVALEMVVAAARPCATYLSMQLYLRPMMVNEGQ